MAVFQSISFHLKCLGILKWQTVSQVNPSNIRTIQVFVLIAMHLCYFAWSIAYFIYGADKFNQYIDVTFHVMHSASLMISYVLFVRRRNQIAEFIEILEIGIENSKSTVFSIQCTYL